MSDLSDWLEANSEALRKIAASTDLDIRVVHLIAALVRADLDDNQIDAQLLGHGLCPDDDQAWPAHLSRALDELRRLAA